MMKNVLMFIGLTLMSLNIQAALLTDLINGQSIIAGDKLFDQWSILYEDSSDFRTINTDNIIVTALNDGGLNPGPGLKFDILNDEFLVEGDNIYAYLDYMFGFRATVLAPELLIKDNSLYLTDAALISPTTLASVFIEESIYTDSTETMLLGLKDVEYSSVFGTVTNKAFDSADFSPLSSVYVTKNILLEAIDFGEAANLLGFEQRFSQVQIPEPGLLGLLTAGILLLGLNKKRAMKK